ncbi:unnamed protein product [Prorocentrum cordatum]|uniref:Uncharacterized protein n=1 Tax=Prorocentrum cordatum TaxID=2364126 RepID=A0ABN9W793_9DINO|nr:unnamed protein product [Polarella glacialis]
MLCKSTEHPAYLPWELDGQMNVGLHQFSGRSPTRLAAARTERQRSGSAIWELASLLPSASTVRVLYTSSRPPRGGGGGGGREEGEEEEEEEKEEKDEAEAERAAKKNCTRPSDAKQGEGGKAGQAPCVRIPRGRPAKRDCLAVSWNRCTVGTGCDGLRASAPSALVPVYD